MKRSVLVIVLATVIIATALVTAENSSTQAQQLIDQNVPCSQLNQTQLELIGDYYMAQIFSPEQHEYMDSMMGGDSSLMTERMHLSLAYTYYCNNSTNYIDSDNYASGVGPGMMGAYYADGSNSYYGPGMMYGLGYYQTSFMYYLPWVLLLLVVCAGIAVIIVLSNRNKKRPNHHRKRK